MRFLVDSGADVSIIPPPKNCKKDMSSHFKLYAANGTEIATYGIKILNLDLGLRRQFQWHFIMGNTDKAILGADFLNKFNLMIDIRNKRLVDGITKLSTNSQIMSIDENKIFYSINKTSKYAEIFEKYPEILKPTFVPTNCKHNIKHFINTTGPPVFSKARRLDPQRLQEAKQEFQFMLENGIIRQSKSQWSSPLHMVNKKDGSIRPCGDYRRLNAKTIPDRYPIPRIEDFNHILENTKFFSKIDLFKAYFQIPLAEEDKEKTAVITPFGLFEFNVMSFGLRNAPSTFQRFINEVLIGLDFVFPYLDDILIASKSEEEHKIHLNLVLERLNKYGLRINLSKSKIATNQLEFLGYLITEDGSKPLPEKVEIIKNYKLPETIQELRSFLGLLNFYRRYLKKAAENQAILHEYLKGAKKNDRRKVQWTEEAKRKFDDCKNELINATLLSFPDMKAPLALFTDASDQALGGVVQQYENTSWKPIAFYSKKLNDAEKKYSAYDKELLAIYASIKNFKHYLEGREFTIFTDHKPLTFAFNQKNEKASPRQMRHLQYISQFSTDIQHISGKENIVADTLSRVNEVEIINYEEIARKQQQDEELEKLKTENQNLTFKQYPLSSNISLWCEISTKNIRPFIPKEFRYQIFKNIHNLAHPGIKNTVKQITSKFIWPNINKDVRQWAQTCNECQKNKTSRHTKSKFGVFEEPDERFKIVHIDLIGPLPPSNDNVYCLTCIDRFSNWMEVIPMKNCEAQTVARKFYKHWISRFGTPVTVITDQGRQFESELFRNLAKLCGIKIQHTTPYHPQSNGKIERLHRTLKSAIRAHKSPKWSEVLPSILLGLRAAIKEETNHSVAEMVYGTNIRLPGEFFNSALLPVVSHPDTFVTELKNQLAELKPVTRKVTQKNIFVHKDLKNCSHVFVRIDRVKKALEPPYEGPFKVLKKEEKYFKIEIKNREVNISIDRLKPAYILDPIENTAHQEPTSSVEPTSSANSNANNQREKTTRSGRKIRFPARLMQ